MVFNFLSKELSYKNKNALDKDTLCQGRIATSTVQHYPRCHLDSQHDLCT